MPKKISRVLKPGTKRKTGSWRSQKPVVDPKKCTRCGLCETFCPDSAIKVGKKHAVVDYDYCKGCAICATVCPKKAITMISEK